VAPYDSQWISFSKFSTWLKRLPRAPMNTRGTAAAQRILMKTFSHKSFWERRFQAPLCFQWKAVTRERHAPKLFHACLDQNLLVTHDVSSTTARFSSLPY